MFAFSLLLFFFLFGSLGRKDSGWSCYWTIPDGDCELRAQDRQGQLRAVIQQQRSGSADGGLPGQHDSGSARNCGEASVDILRSAFFWRKKKWKRATIDLDSDLIHHFLRFFTFQGPQNTQKVKKKPNEKPKKHRQQKWSKSQLFCWLLDCFHQQLRVFLVRVRLKRNLVQSPYCAFTTLAHSLWFREKEKEKNENKKKNKKQTKDNKKESHLRSSLESRHYILKLVSVQRDFILHFLGIKVWVHAFTQGGGEQFVILLEQKSWRMCRVVGQAEIKHHLAALFGFIDQTLPLGFFFLQSVVHQKSKC